MTSSPIPIRQQRAAVGDTIVPTTADIELWFKMIREGATSSEQALVHCFQPGVEFFLKRSSTTGTVHQAQVLEIFRLVIVAIKTKAIRDRAQLEAMLVRLAKTYGKTTSIGLVTKTKAHIAGRSQQVNTLSRNRSSKNSNFQLRPNSIRAQVVPHLVSKVRNDKAREVFLKLPEY